MDTILGYLNSGLSAIIPFIILLGLLIFVHEMGHFLVAKYFGVRVEVFSLGFGKKILQYKKGDTTYCLSLIPLGGYVKMFGDDITANISESEKKYSFTHKPVMQRIAVVLAGPLMNFFFAILIFLIVALMGEQVKAPIAGDIANGTYAHQMGFRSGDEILKAGGESVRSWDHLVDIMSKNYGQPLSLEIRRAHSDQISTLTATPQLVENPNILSAKSSVGDIEGLAFSAKSSVVGVKHNSIAAKAGLQTGDLIKSIAGTPVKYLRELDNIFVSLQGQPFDIEVERYENIENPVAKNVKITIPKAQYASMNAIGIESSELFLAKIVPESPAEAAGLKAGDRIVQVNETIPQVWEDVLTNVKSYKGEGVLSLQVEREGKIEKFEITPKMTSHMTSQGGEEKRFTVGIIPWAIPAMPETKLIKYSGISSLTRGFERTVDVSVMTVMSFVRLFQTKISPKQIGGVISIGQAASETFKVGISQFLQMMAVISINLFILNLLPIPVLDGGHLLFYTIEAVRGAPVSLKKMEIAQQIGLVALMSLMVFSLFNDISRVFFGAW